MKQAYLVHYYIVGYINRKEKYLIPVDRFSYFIPRYLGSRHLNLIWIVKLTSINSCFNRQMLWFVALDIIHVAVARSKASELKTFLREKWNVKGEHKSENGSIEASLLEISNHCIWWKVSLIFVNYIYFLFFLFKCLYIFGH